jgi:hypothetical protein
VRAPTAYRHGIGHVALGCHTNIDIADAAALLADVLSRVDDWDEVRALTKLLRAASEYDDEAARARLEEAADERR